MSANDAEKENDTRSDATRDLFFELLDLESDSQRTDFLDAHCANDPEKRARLIELLDAHNDAGDFASGEHPSERESTAEEKDFRLPIAEGPGSTIGRYRLLQKIGEGGFGIVYMAEQREPVKRRVALKIIKLGMDTRQVVGRFEAERQALALMEHPNIAKVLDAGATETGRPYFVMELVKGIPITEFCNDRSLDTGSRLQLFAQVCRAIHHAHQKGVIHRDIKPGNVLITMHDDQPVPKVIDFGIAKATQQELTEITIFTRFQEFIGTPAYMSPEQAQLSGLDIDTRTDIYSLGVLLYELLTGRTPFDAKELLTAGFDEMRRQIREVDPLKPSTRLNTMEREELTTIARQRSDEPEHLRQLMKGELDWIIMKALDKDRSRRYESAAAFAQDVERYLSDEPVDAAAPGLAYRASKFAKRHRAIFIVSITFVFLLVTGIITTTTMAIRARIAEHNTLQFLNMAMEQRMASEVADNRTGEALKLLEKEAERAQREAAISAAIVSFLNEDIFTGIATEENVTHEMTVATLLDRAASSVGTRFESEPIVEAAVRHTLAKTFYTMGRHPEAREQAERAYSIRQEQLGEAAEGTLESQVLLGDLLNRLGSQTKGMSLVSNALETARANLEPAHPTTIAAQVRLAWMHYGIKGHHEECKELIHQAVSLAREQPGVDPINFIRALHLQARMVNADEGEALYRESITYADSHLGPNHPWTFNARGGLAAFLYDSNKNLPEAERLTRQAMLENIRIFGDTHPSALLFRSNLRLILSRQQRWGESVFHDLKNLQLIKRPATTLNGIMTRLGRSPLAEITAAGNSDTITWRSLQTLPIGGWIFPDFVDESWQEGFPKSTPTIWLRGILNTDDPAAFTPVILIRGDGHFEVSINGRPANPVGVHTDGTTHMLVPTEEVRATMRAGRNLIAIHGNGLGTGPFPEIKILRGPDLDEFRPESAGFQSGF